MTLVRLTEAQKADIKYLRESGLSYAKVAREVGCSVSTVQRLTGGPDVRHTIQESQQNWRKNNPDKVAAYRKDQIERTTHPLVIYVAYSPDQPGMVKVGSTTNLKRRLVTLRTGAPGMVFLETWEGSIAEERQIHAILSQRRIKSTAREWFSFDSPEEACATIRLIREQVSK